MGRHYLAENCQSENAVYAEAREKENAEIKAAFIADRDHNEKFQEHLLDKKLEAIYSLSNSITQLATAMKQTPIINISIDKDAPDGLLEALEMRLKQ
mgnify:CR=1 FL=1